MLEESVPSLWTTMTSWFTPTLLFLLLNLMIGIIAISSSLNRNKHNDQSQEQNRHLGRYPSMLHRLKSINFHSYTSQESSTAFETHHDASYQQHQQPSMLQRLKSINFCSYISQEPTFHARKPEETKTIFSHDNKLKEERANYRYVKHEQENVVQGHDMTLEATYQQLQQPSMLQRLKSINFYSNISQEPTFHAQKPEESKTIFSHDKHHEEDGANYRHAKEEDENVAQEHDMTLDQVYMQLKSNKYNRTKSDTKPASGELPPKLPTKMRKSASTKSAFSHFEENDIVETRRPATVKEGTIEADEEVDAKADDFINKFKQQLKLQRIDSIMRYKELIGRGTKNCA